MPGFEENVLNDSIDYVGLNLSQMNLAGSSYRTALSAALDYTGQKPGAETLDEVLKKITYYKGKIDEAEKNVTDLSDTLSAELDHTKMLLPKEDFSAVGSSIRMQLQDMIGSLDFLYAILAQNALSMADQYRICELYLEYYELTCQYMYICTNEMYAGVDPKFMKKFITEYLPTIPEIYAVNMEWTTNADMLKSREDTVYEKLNKNVNDLASHTGDMQNQLSRDEKELGQ